MAGAQKEAGEDAQAVAALLSLGAIGVEDAQAEGFRIFGHGQGAQQDAVGTDALAPVAEGLGEAGRHLDGCLGGVQHEIVTAEGLELVDGEIVGHEFFLG